MQIERNYLRKSYRINLPVKVKIKGKEFKVKDWSFLGFRIEKSPRDIIKKGDEVIVDFELPFASFDLSFKAKAVCRWATQKEAGFEFIELSDEVKLIMKEYVEAYVEGRLESVGDVLSVAEGIEIPVELEEKLTEKEKKELDKKLKRTLTIYGLITIIVFAIGFFVYHNLPVVYSAEAFISGKTIDILSPEEGILSKLYVKTGEFVKKGEPLLSIKNNKLEQEKKLLEFEIGQIVKSIQRTKSQIDKISGTKFKKDKNQNPIYFLDNQIKVLNQELKRKKQLLSQYKKAYDLGILKKSTLMKLENEISNLKIKIYDLKQKRLQLLAGEDINTDIQKIKLLRDLNILLTNEKQKLFELKSRLSQVKKALSNLVIYAPQKGYILSIHKIEGSFVKKHEPLMVLDIPSKDMYVVARYKLKDAIKIKVGNKAEVYIPSLNLVLKGKVISIGKTGLSSESRVSETESYALKDVPVKIKIKSPKVQIFSGTYAEVKVITEKRYIFIIDFIDKII